MNRDGSLSYFCSMEEPGSEHIFSKKVVFRPVLNVFIDFILKNSRILTSCFVVFIHIFIVRVNNTRIICYYNNARRKTKCQ